MRQYKKGDELETIILAIDPERERISLGVKQLAEDPFAHYLSANEKGTLVKGTVAEVDAKGATINLADGITGTLKASEISKDRVEDARTVLKEGDEVEVKIISIDRKNRAISLSIKAKDEPTEREQPSSQSTAKDQKQEPAIGPKTIGDLIKAQMGGSVE